MRLSDEWGAIVEAVGPPAAVFEPAVFDPWDRITARRAADSASRLVPAEESFTPDSWDRITARRAADSVSHAKTSWLPVVLIAAGIWVIFNSMNGKH